MYRRLSINPWILPEKYSFHQHLSEFCRTIIMPLIQWNAIFENHIDSSKIIGFRESSHITDWILFLAATKQLYEWFSPSVRPSVRLSVCLSVTPFSLCSHHCIIMKFSGVITSDKSDVHAKGQGQRSKVKVTEVTTQLNRFRTVTPVWIHMWWWNDAYSLIMLRRGALSFFKVIREISRSHGSKNCRIWPRLGVSGL